MQQISNDTEATAAGLQAGFSRLVSDYDGVIRKVCYFYARDVDDFNDLHQESLVNLWRGYARFRGEARLSTWIYRVCLNSCISYFRRNRKIDSTVSIDNHPELVDDSGEKAEMLRQMYGLINRLGDSDKAVILLWLDEHPYEEIAAIMDIPRNTVASRIRRAKEKLVALNKE